MALSFLFASIGILNPGGTPAAKSLQLLSVQLATPLLLLSADLRDCLATCGPLLEAFLVAAGATMVACLVGWKFCGPSIQSALGVKDGLVIAAALMAKNIGGGINYVAVCRSLQASPAAMAAGLCVDNLFALVYFPITSYLGSGRPDVIEEERDTIPKEDTSETADSIVSLEERPTTIQHASTVLSLAAATIWLGERLGGPSGALPCSTLLTVLLASVLPTSFLQPLQPAAHVLGTTALYLFFATAGAPGLAVAESVRASLVPLSLFLGCLYSIHGTILAILHKVLPHRKALTPQRLLVASSAAIGGPATAAALAQAQGWTTLVAPSLLVGSLGYALATFCGLAYFQVFFGR